MSVLGINQVTLVLHSDVFAVWITNLF